MKRIKQITRPATAIALGAALALSPIATTPAKAGNEEALIAGAIGTLILGAIAAEVLSGSQGNVTVRTHTPTHHYNAHGIPPRTPHHQAHNPNRHNPNRHGSQNHGHPPRHGHPNNGHNGNRHGNWQGKQLPANCVIATGRGANAGVYLGKRCLRNNYAAAHNLPGYCQTQMVNQQNGRVRNVYNGTCLQRAGYTIQGTGGRR